MLPFILNSNQIFLKCAQPLKAKLAPKPSSELKSHKKLLSQDKYPSCLSQLPENSLRRCGAYIYIYSMNNILLPRNLALLGALQHRQSVSSNKFRRGIISINVTKNNLQMQPLKCIEFTVAEKIQSFYWQEIVLSYPIELVTTLSSQELQSIYSLYQSQMVPKLKTQHPVSVCK